VGGVASAVTVLGADVSMVLLRRPRHSGRLWYTGRASMKFMIFMITLQMTFVFDNVTFWESQQTVRIIAHHPGVTKQTASMSPSD